MDVERLMKDLTVEELDNIQGNLQTEMEGKKEELRDMVGRRYRDVLEASSEVRQVRQLAETLANSVGLARNTQSTVDTRSVPRGQQATLQKFVALHRLLPLIGDDSGDGLSDAFCLLLAENIHRELVTEHISPVMHNVISGLTGRLLRTRRVLIQDLENELGELDQCDWTANQLTALSLLKDTDLDSLLDMYLSARKTFLSNNVADSPSLLSIVGDLKATLTVVDELFVKGQLARAMQAVGTAGWRPALIDSLSGDQAFSFHRMMNTEVERVNRCQRDRKTGQLLTQRINDKCNVWIESVCELAHPSVVTVCEFYEKADDVIEFVQALGAVLRENWPRISSNTTLYQKLFKEVVIDKFKGLVERDLLSLEDSLVSRLPSVSTAPMPMMERRAGKFDALLGVGISSALHESIVSLFEGVQRVRDCCSRYEKVGMESRMDTIRETMAETVEAIITRLSSCSSLSSSAPSDCLSRARLCLALIHGDPSAVCSSLNKDGDRISRCSRTLHSAIEQALGQFSCQLAADCLSESALREVIESTSHVMNGLATATEWESVTLAEVGRVDVPLSLCPPVHSALFSLSRRLSDSAISHLLSRTVRKTLATEIGRLLSVVMSATVSRNCAVQRTWIQLLFDCRLLNSLFPHDGLKQLIPSIESNIDPFDLSLISTHLSTNVRLAVHRNQLLFSTLIVDVLPNKDTQTSQTYSQVVDIVPRMEHPLRVSLIPRLDRNPADEVSKRMQAAKAPKNKLLAGPNQAGGSKNAASLSSLYDKMSSSFSFFGN